MNAIHLFLRLLRKKILYKLYRAAEPHRHRTQRLLHGEREKMERRKKNLARVISLLHWYSVDTYGD